MANISFKRGANLSNLSVVDGQFIVNTAEHSIYVDVSTETGAERLRIGDFIHVQTLNDLPAAAHPNCLYLVDEINCLCYNNGTGWVQINRDTGATSVEITGEGNVVTGISYDAASRKLTVTKGMTAITPDEVDAKITAADTDLRAYVNEKTAGIATDVALGELQAKVTAAEGEIDALQEQVGTGTVSSQIDAKIEALDLENAYDAKGAADAVQTALNEYKTANDKALADEAAAARAAESANATAAAEAKAAADAAQQNVDALEAKVGTPTEGKTIVEMITDAQTAASYDDTEVQAAIAANAASIADVKGDVNAFLAAAEVGDEAIDTLKEIQEYIESDGAAAATMTQNIAQNAADIDAVEERATTLEGEMDAAEARLDAVEPRVTAVEGKVTALEGTSHTHANKAELDLIVAGDKAKWDVAEQNAKDYADELNEAMDTRVDALEGTAHEHTNKTVLDGITETKVNNWDDAATKAHTHDNKDVLDGITAEQVAAWGSALTEAKAYTDTAKTELAAVDTANLAEAKSYTDTEITSALEWGEF